MAEHAVALRDNVNYAVKLTFERCPTTGRDHLHAYFYSRNKKSWKAAKEWLHVFARCGNGQVTQLDTLAHAQNVFEYVGKDYTRLEDPVSINCDALVPSYVTAGAGCPESGAGGDLVNADWKRRVVVLFGPNSTGKSYYANQKCVEFTSGDEKPFLLQTAAAGQQGRWPGDYAGQRTCIIDEFGFNDFPLAQLKTLLDRQPQEVATAAGGKSVFWKPELIFLCCNCTPAEMKEFGSHPQWVGRIHEFKFMNVFIQAPGAAPAVWTDLPANGNPDYADGRPYVAPSLPAPLKRHKSNTK